MENLNDQNNGLPEDNPAADEEVTPVVPPESEYTPVAPQPAPEETGTPAAEPKIVYQWSYEPPVYNGSVQEKEDKKGRGVLIFAIIMSVCFAVTLMALIASFMFGGYRWMEPIDPDTTDDPSDYDEPTVPDDEQEPSRPSKPNPDEDEWDEPDHGYLPDEDEGPETVPTPDDVPYGDGEIKLGDGSGEELTRQEISALGNPVVVAITITSTVGSGSGTGIIMTEDGYIATNAHVVEDAQTITVLTYDGKEYDAVLIGASEIDDLAVIKVNGEQLPVATFGDSSTAQVGDRTTVIGHPAGLEFGWTSTYGYLSAINRDVKIRDYDGTMTKKMTLLQTDANVNSGNSGGPMFNSRGEVIGIITMKLAGDYEGMGFAIPSNGAVPLLEALMRTGTTEGVESEVSSQRPQLGITGVSVEKDHYYVLGTNRIYELTEAQAATTADSFKAAATGALITSVATAADAYDKLIEGDIVIAINGKSLSNMDAMREYLYDLRVGDTVTITYVRDGEEQTVSILLTPPTE